MNVFVMKDIDAYLTLAQQAGYRHIIPDGHPASQDIITISISMPFTHPIPPLHNNIWLPLRLYSVRKSISLMISIPSTEAVEFVFMARMTFL